MTDHDKDRVDIRIGEKVHDSEQNILEAAGIITERKLFRRLVPLYIMALIIIILEAWRIHG